MICVYIKRPIVLSYSLSLYCLFNLGLHEDYIYLASLVVLTLKFEHNYRTKTQKSTNHYTGFCVFEHQSCPQQNFMIKSPGDDFISIYPSARETNILIQPVSFRRFLLSFSLGFILNIDKQLLSFLISRMSNV